MKLRQELRIFCMIDCSDGENPEEIGNVRMLPTQIRSNLNTVPYKHIRIIQLKTDKEPCDYFCNRKSP